MNDYRILFQELKEGHNGKGVRELLAIHTEDSDKQTLCFFNDLKQYAMPPGCRLDLADIRVAELFHANQHPVCELDDLKSVDKRIITQFGYELLTRQGRIKPLDAVA